MSAGTGVLHSESNPSRDRPVHFLQIWILPAEEGLAPSYEQRAFPEAERRGRLRLVASPDGRDGSLVVHQDVRVFLTLLAEGEAVGHELAAGRRALVQVARGEASVNGERLRAGDGAAIAKEGALLLSGLRGPAEVLLFDLA